MPARSPSHRLSRRDVLKGAAAAGIGAITGSLAHGYFYERFHIELTRETLTVSGLPHALAGLRIGFVTDLHRSDTVSHEMVDRAVRLVMAEAARPDHPRRRLRDLGRSAVRATRRRGACAALGAPRRLRGAGQSRRRSRHAGGADARNGIAVLRDARTRLTIRGETLDLAGIRFWTRRLGDIAHVLRGASPNVILLAHTPMRLAEAAALAVPLVLSGHTHGGQIVLPGVGAVAAREFPVVAGTGTAKTRRSSSAGASGPCTSRCG